MALVAAQLHEVPIVFSTELDLEPAVALAQDARRRLPVGHEPSLHHLRTTRGRRFTDPVASARGLQLLRAMKGLGPSILISLALIIGMWLVGQVMGFNVSVIGSLVLTIGLTLVLNLVFGAFRGRSRSLRR
jgi:hypothetical protein